jgi:hypothetical protein
VRVHLGFISNSSSCSFTVLLPMKYKDPATAEELISEVQKKRGKESAEFLRRLLRDKGIYTPRWDVEYELGDLMAYLVTKGWAIHHERGDEDNYDIDLIGYGERT